MISFLSPLCSSRHLLMMLIDEFQRILHLHKRQAILTSLQIIIGKCNQNGCLNKIIPIQLCQSQSSVCQFQFQRRKTKLPNQFLNENPT